MYSLYKFPILTHEFEYIENQNVPALIHDFQYAFEEFLYKSPNSIKMLKKCKVINIGIMNSSIYLYKVHLGLIMKMFNNFLNIKRNNYKVNYNKYSKIKQLFILDILIYKSKNNIKLYLSNKKYISRKDINGEMLTYNRHINRLIIFKESYLLDISFGKKLLYNISSKEIIYKRKHYIDKYKYTDIIYLNKNTSINKLDKNIKSIYLKYRRQYKYIFNIKKDNIYIYSYNVESRIFKNNNKCLYCIKPNNTLNLYVLNNSLYLNKFYKSKIFKTNNLIYIKSCIVNEKIYASKKPLYLKSTYMKQLYVNRKSIFIIRRIERKYILHNNINKYLNKIYLGKMILKQDNVIMLNLSSRKSLFINDNPIFLEKVYSALFKDDNILGLSKFYTKKIYKANNVELLLPGINANILDCSYNKYLYDYMRTDIILSKKNIIYLIDNYKDRIAKSIPNKFLCGYYRTQVNLMANKEKYFSRYYFASIYKDNNSYYLQRKSYEYKIYKSKNGLLVSIIPSGILRDTEYSNKYLIRYKYHSVYISKDKNKYLKKYTHKLLKSRNEQRWLKEAIIKQILKSEGKTKYLDLKPTWYIIESDGVTDELIIPNIDYPYEKEEISGISKHPISSISDINYGDTEYGIHKIAVSIKIMQQMLNFLFVIWNGKVNEFSNIKATEAIEQTMTGFYDWLNIDKVIEEMNEKNVREDYLRVYRWFRWEAEKVWIEEKDTNDTGLKSVGMLIANIIRYMKNHHYDIVPITKKQYLFELSDILRAFTIKFIDYYRLPDKIKGNRDYIINMGKNKINK